MGALSEKELTVLQTTLANLKKENQTPEELKAQLKKLKATLISFRENSTRKLNNLRDQINLPPLSTKSLEEAYG